MEEYLNQLLRVLNGCHNQHHTPWTRQEPEVCLVANLSVFQLLAPHLLYRLFLLHWFWCCIQGVVITDIPAVEPLLCLCANAGGARAASHDLQVKKEAKEDGGKVCGGHDSWWKVGIELETGDTAP
jgi:hypothetical protein